MHKWGMAALFFGAFFIGFIFLFVQADENKVEKEANVEVSEEPLNEAAAIEVFKANCIACHGAELEGGPAGPALKTVGATMKEADIVKKINNGGGIMPAFKGKVDDADIANLAKWLAEHK